MKLSGACGLASALTCALVTVTTTVLHMSRLQALRECEYTKKTRTCTCYPMENNPQQEDNGTGGGGSNSGFDESKFFLFSNQISLSFSFWNNSFLFLSAE